MKIHDKSESDLEICSQLFEALKKSDKSLEQGDKEVLAKVASSLLELAGDRTKRAENSSAERADEAVGAAAEQLDRGESWEAYAEVNMEQEIPMSVRERAEEAQSRTLGPANRRGFKAEDLQRKLALNSGLLAC